MFKVGDAVCLNPKYYYPGMADIIRGFISSETESWSSEQYIIYWEDGKKGNTVLDPKTDYLILV